MVYTDYYSDDSIANIFYFDEGRLHRFDGPAVIAYKRDGSLLREKYYINGKLHRIDGPAYIEYIGDLKLEKHFIKNRYIKKDLWDELHKMFKERTFIYKLVKEDDKMMIVYSSLARYYDWEEAHSYFDNYKIMKRLIGTDIEKGSKN